MDRGFAIDALFNPAVLFTLGLVLLPLGIIALSILDTWSAPTNEEREPAVHAGSRSRGGAAVYDDPVAAGAAKVYAAGVEQPAPRVGDPAPVRRQ